MGKNLFNIYVFRAITKLNLSTNEKLLLLYYCSHNLPRKMTIDTIILATSLSLSSLKRANKALVEKRLLKKSRFKNQGVIIESVGLNAKGLLEETGGPILDHHRPTLDHNAQGTSIYLKKSNKGEEASPPSFLGEGGEKQDVESNTVYEYQLTNSVGRNGVIYYPRLVANSGAELLALMWNELASCRGRPFKFESVSIPVLGALRDSLCGAWKSNQDASFWEMVFRSAISGSDMTQQKLKGRSMGLGEIIEPWVIQKLLPAPLGSGAWINFGYKFKILNQKQK